MERFLLLIVTILCMSVSAEGFTLIHKEDAPHGLMENGQQSVHTETHIIYANPGDTLRLYRPERMAFTGYIRWYCYDTDSAAQGIIHDDYNVSAWNDKYTISNERGLFKRREFVNGTNRQSKEGSEYYEVDYIMHSGDSIYRIAVDESIYWDYTPNEDWRAKGTTTLTEPTLSKRIIYEIHPAFEIASRIDTCTGDVFLEEHELIAPVGRQLYIGPNYRFTCNDEGVQIYRWRSKSNYYYNEASPIQMYNMDNWKWEIDGDAQSKISMISSQYIKASCSAPGTHVYKLKYKAEDTYYNIAKFTITYVDVASVGPVEHLPTPTTKMSLIYENTFNYDEPGVDDVTTFWNGWLGAEESTYGYFFSSLRAYRDHHRDEPNWCEYGIVNLQDIYGSSSMIYNHIDGLGNIKENAKKGYMIFVDGSQQPGQVFNLKVNADLCPGSRMYFSAWLIDASSTGDGSKCAPNMDFIVVGIDNNNEEHPLTTFTTGEFGCNAKNDVNKNGNMQRGVWYQIMFPVDIDASEIYQTYRLKIMNKGRSADGNDFAIDDIRIYVQKPPVTPIQASTYDCPSGNIDSITAYLRVDYQAIDQTQNVFYYQWRDEANQVVETDYHNGTELYGVVNIPASESAIIESGDTCLNLLSFDAQYYNTDTPVVKYIKESVDAETERYIMYIAQPLYVRTNYTYTGFVASRQSDLGDKGGCGTHADLMVAGGTRILIDGEALGDSVVSLCGQRSYTLDIVLTYITQNKSTGELEEHTTPCRADWLIGDSAFVNENKELYSGASFDEIEAAIVDHRISGSNPLVLKLVKNDLLVLDTATTNMQPAKSLSYTAFPVDGSAENGMSVCLTPRFLYINPEDTIKNIMIVGGEDDDLPEIIKLTPRRIRVSEYQIKQGSFNLPVYPSGDGGVYYVIDSIRLVSTTNPDWHDEVVLNGRAEHDTINSADTIYIWGNKLQRLDPGFDYTFHVSFKDEETTCDRGYTYFTLRIIPDVVTWYGDNWNEDVNWSSFIPLPETNVILLSRDYNVTFTEDTIYDINYIKNQCASIYLPIESSLAGQEKITINGQAYIDIQEYAWKWNLTSIPLKGVVSGDIFVNQNESTDPFTVNPIRQEVGTFAEDRLTFKLYQSEFDKTANKWLTSTNILTRLNYPGEAIFVGVDCETDENNPVVRLPKVDDFYRYFGKSSHNWLENSEYISRITEYGKLAYTGDTIFTLKELYNEVYLFGNPTLGYIDITKLVYDNSDKLTGRYFLEPEGISYFPNVVEFIEDVYNSDYHILLPPTKGILLEGKSESNILDINVTPKIINSSGRVPLRRTVIGDTNIPTSLSNGFTGKTDKLLMIFDIYGRRLGTTFIDDLPRGFYILKYESYVKKIYKAE